MWSKSILIALSLGLVPQTIVSQAQKMQELRLSAPCGVLRITAQAENAVRVRCGSGTTNPEP